MLNVRTVLRKHCFKFAGRRIDVITWRKLAEEIISNNLKEIPPEFTIRDIWEIARGDGLVIELSGGYIAISPILWTEEDWKKIDERRQQGGDAPTDS